MGTRYCLGSALADALPIRTEMTFATKKGRGGLPPAASGLAVSLASLAFFSLGTSDLLADCSQTGSLTFTCGGDLSAGLVIQDEVPASTVTVNVQDITVVPDSSLLYGIRWALPTSGNDVSFNLDTGDLTLENEFPLEFGTVRDASFSFTGAAKQVGSGSDRGPIYLEVGDPAELTATFDGATVTSSANGTNVDAVIGAVEIESWRTGSTNSGVQVVFDGDGLTTHTSGDMNFGFIVKALPRRGGGAAGVSMTSSSTAADAALRTTTEGDTAAGAFVVSQGGIGVSSGNNGGDAGAVSVEGAAIEATTSGNNSSGVVVYSRGGRGRNGSGDGNGGAGGSAGTTNLHGVFTISTSGEGSPGVAVSSIGGRGGAGSGKGSAGSAGSGGVSSYRGLTGSSTQTAGDSSPGAVLQSIGGHGGAADNVTGLFAFAADGGSGGDGGLLFAANNGSITTEGNGSAGLELQSIGGGGGSGGSSFGLFYSKGGSGGKAGVGGDINVTTASISSITTLGNSAPGISAQTIGGTGGSGGSSAGLVTIGGYASGTAEGGDITVNHAGSISTGENPTGDGDSSTMACEVGCSYGILAQTIGGGGGNGGSSTGWFSLGGAGSGGGFGGSVEVTSSGSVATALENSTGILAQSIGGGGGNGGASVSGGAFGSLSIGGSGGNGGNGGQVTVSMTDSASVATSGDGSHAVHAQSLGGGGGNAGFSVALSGGVVLPTVSVSLGGSGGAGGDGSSVDIAASANTSILTEGDGAHGLFAQSIGGGGGNGGFAVSLAGGTSGAASIGIGGTGGSGGEASTATIVSDASVRTRGDSSSALIAQSIAGGGGNGGFTVSASASSTIAGISVGVGGTGGGGKDASTVGVINAGALATEGDLSPGLVAQSIGGGGGNGGLSIAGTVTVSATPALALSVGGGVERSGAGGTVEVENYSTITTKGSDSPGALVQSIGGGGGSGGLAIAGTFTAGASASGAGGFGGAGGDGGEGDDASFYNEAMIDTSGDRSPAVQVQSIGGGGGSGGATVAGTVTTGGTDSLALSVGLAGEGGNSNRSASAEVISSGDLFTAGDFSSGIVAQSIGGGGGNGGTSISANISTSSTKSLSASIGGGGGSAGRSGTATVTANNDISTSGLQSDGLLAQSIGGSGGNGGTSVSGSITTSNSTQLGLAIGGLGGNAGDGGAVIVNPSSGRDGESHDITVTGDGSRGIVAQSIGGGGGNGGMALTGNLTTSSTTKTLSLTIGGSGGAAGAGLDVGVYHKGAISTGVSGTQSLIGLNHEHGILAQSISGGGGTGGLAATGSNNKGNQSLTLSIGGSGGRSVESGEVTVVKDGSITTYAPYSHGVLAQSIAGGGGNAGGTTTYQYSDSDTDSKAFALSIGGSGVSGNNSGAVEVSNSGSIIASGLGSRGLVAQSIGGGGGSGGSNVFQSNQDDGAAAVLTLGIGGGAGAGGGGGTVSVLSSGAIVTGMQGSNGDDLASNTAAGYGIFAQSISGGGGSGGSGISGPIQTSGDNSLVLGIGGGGSGADDGGSVSVETDTGGSVTTFDDGAHGVVAQSIGGGGGDGGAGITGDVSNGSTNALTVGVGGSSGSGSGGGSVTVDLDDDVTVFGDGAKAIVAQSIGGGGGSGGIGIEGDVSGSDDSKTNQLTVGVGGTSGSGGAGGDVAVTMNADISTGGDGDALVSSIGAMDGIFAQSIAGGGGDASAGISGDITNSSESTALTLGISLSGGNSDSGGAVTVSSAGATIQVLGDGSRGIVAQSIGGSGGEGNVGIGGSIESAESSSETTQLDLGIGGSGGGGGDGGPVAVTNAAAIATNVTNVGGFTGNHGIIAQSLGGGGGNGGIGVAGDVTNPEKSKALTIGIGGSSDSGGAGSSVTVTNTGRIDVRGSGSYGVFAQSIGGGGGTGGIGVDGDIAGEDDASSVTQLALGLGGSGGAGGDGGQVYVENTAAINSLLGVDGEGAMMHGIFAQSIGGGGGSGDVGVGGKISGSEDSKALTLAVGGSGGSGGSAAAGATGEVTLAGVGVLNQGAISVAGDGSKGIFAQSVGGGGGDGSAGLSGSVDSGDGEAVTLSVGTTGGSGGDGGVVKVVNTGNITTGILGTGNNQSINELHGVFAQSIGGGGGTGSLTGSLLFGSTATSGTEKGLAITLGGTAGAGDGGDVTIANGVLDDGAIVPNDVMTYNINSHALFAQSIGGGGGSAGDLGGITTEGDGEGWKVAASFGASSGNDGDGGDVKVIAEGNKSVTTVGFGSYGIFAQSIGGGGGDGVNAASQYGTSDATFALNFGASDGSGGKGGTVTVESNSSLETLNRGAVGIFAQSVGGGGGKGANEAGGLSGTLTLGGTGGASGHGGDVAVTVGGEGVDTFGNRAHGVVAQSIGGGGGYAGRLNFNSDTTYGSGLDFGADGTAIGNGGAVTVNVIDTGFQTFNGVYTRGHSTASIFAQSIGGGGGVAGDLDGGSDGTLIGSGSGSGTGGNVDVNLSNTLIYATGNRSYGVFAQSAGGSGMMVSADTKLSVSLVEAEVSAPSSDSTGIYAESSGQERGSIEISIDELSAVGGGIGTGADGAGAAAIFIKDGVTNHIINDGRIVSADRFSSGRAVVSEGVGTTSVTNNGVIRGQVLLNQSSSLSAGNEASAERSVVVNEAGGMLFSSLIVADEMLNRGTQVIGPDDEIGTTRVVGDYKQSSSGRLVIGVDPERAGSGDQVSDELVIDGSAELDGAVEVSLLSTVQDVPGEITTRIVHTTQDQALGATTAGLEVEPSVVAQYELSSDANNDIFLSFDIDYVNKTAAAPMANNTFNASENFNLLAQAGDVDEATAQYLISFSDPYAYATFMDSLNSEVFVNNQITTLRSNLLFNDQMTRCEESESSYLSPDQNYCIFLSGEATRLDRSASSSNEGFHSTWWQFTGGGEITVDDDWRFGGALAYQARNQTTSFHNNSTSDGDGFLAGAYATRFLGPIELTGSAMTGVSWFDTTRNPLNAGETTATQSVWTVSTRVGAAYRYDYESFFVRPGVDFGFDFVDGSSFTEGGDNPYRLAVDGDGDSFFTLQPSLEVGAEFEAREGLFVRLRMSVGLVQFLGNSSASQTARYVTGPTYLPSYATTTDLGATQLEFGGGLDIISANNFTLRADGYGSLNSDYSNYGGGLGVVIPF